MIDSLTFLPAPLTLIFGNSGIDSGIDSSIILESRFYLLPNPFLIPEEGMLSVIWSFSKSDEYFSSSPFPLDYWTIISSSIVSSSGMLPLFFTFFWAFCFFKSFLWFFTGLLYYFIPVCFCYWFWYWLYFMSFSGINCSGDWFPKFFLMKREIKLFGSFSIDFT